jgi:hypothetical protein
MPKTSRSRKNSSDSDDEVSQPTMSRPRRRKVLVSDESEDDSNDNSDIEESEHKSPPRKNPFRHFQPTNLVDSLPTHPSDQEIIRQHEVNRYHEQKSHADMEDIDDDVDELQEDPEAQDKLQQILTQNSQHHFDQSHKSLHKVGKLTDQALEFDSEMIEKYRIPQHDWTCLRLYVTKLGRGAEQASGALVNLLFRYHEQEFTGDTKRGLLQYAEKYQEAIDARRIAPEKNRHTYSQCDLKLLAKALLKQVNVPEDLLKLTKDLLHAVKLWSLVQQEGSQSKQWHKEGLKSLRHKYLS